MFATARLLPAVSSLALLACINYNTASAALHSVDEFDGSTIANGGSGWTSDWNGGATAGGNLIYANLITTGSGLAQPAWVFPYRTFAYLANSANATNNGVVWFSWIQGCDTPQSGAYGARVDFLSSVGGFHSEFSIGNNWQDGNIHILSSQGGFGVAAATTVPIDQTNFLAVKVDFVNSNITLYVNPVGLGSGSAPSSADATVSATFAQLGGNIDGIDTPQIISAPNSGNMIFDEFRYGDNWADVSPVPTATATTTTLTSSKNPSTNGDQVVLTATVSSSTSTGTVTFKDGTATLGLGTVVAGVAKLTNNFVYGLHNLQALYSGDINYSASLGTLTQTTYSTDLPAGLLAYDNFLNTNILAGGEGWNSAWSGGSLTSLGYGLHYSSLVVSTNAVSVDNNLYANPNRTISFPVTTTGGTTWISLVMVADGTEQFTRLDFLHGSTTIFGAGCNYEGNTPKTFELYDGAFGGVDGVTNRDTGYATAGTNFIVISVQTNLVTLYINPTGLGTGFAPLGAAAVVSDNIGTASTYFDGIRLVSGALLFEVGNLRVGSTWASVSPSTAVVAAANITGITRAINGNVTVTATGTPSSSYKLLTSTSLTTPRDSWTQVGSSVTADGSGKLIFTDPATTPAEKFYIISN